MPAAHVPTENDHSYVRALVIAGIPQAQIAEIVGIGADTLRHHYREDIDFGNARANAVGVGRL